MDKGKSKTDLRAAGKKRLEEYRQKRQQKGGSTKSSTTTTLKTLTQGEQNVGENAVEEISRRASLLKAQRSSSQKDGEVESVMDHVHRDALEERHAVDVVFDTSPGSSVTSSVQRSKVGGGHLAPETSEQSVESRREPGSSNGNSNDEDREAVYTILWEDHGTENSQRTEEWQESTFDGGVNLHERGLHQGNCSSFWVDNESYGNESKEGLSTQRKLSGNSIGGADKFQSSEDSEVNRTLSNSFSESELGEQLQSVQGMLQARDMELMYAIAKLEGATRVISEQEEAARSYVQQNERLQMELTKCYEDLGMLKSNVNVAEERMIGLKNDLHEVFDSFNSSPKERYSQTEGVTLSMNEMVVDVNSLARAIVEKAHRRDMELQSANETAMAALLHESNTSKDLLTNFEREFRDSRNAAQNISWLSGASPPQSSVLEWATWLIDTLENEHRNFEQQFRLTESMTMAATANTLLMQNLQGKIDSLHTELSNQREETEAVADDLRSRDLELQIARNKLQEQVQNCLALESEVESARSMCRVEGALTGLEDAVGGVRFQGRPPWSSTPSEWISWLIQILREVTEELKTSESASDVLSLQVEEFRNSHSSLYAELLSQKNESENLQSKHATALDLFVAERDSLQAEIQDLKASSMEISRREFDHSEALKTVAILEEALASKDRELSKLQAEVDDLSVRSAQQHSSIQSLMEERERLTSEVVDGKAHCNLLEAETAQTANEKSNLQSDVNQLEQKLGFVREKLNVAINKGKGLVKQRDLLKKSLVEETNKVEALVLSHATDIQSKDSELREMRSQVDFMSARVQELQAEVSSLFEKACAHQQSLEAERQGLESVFVGIEISKDLLHGDPIEKVKWLVSVLEGARNTSNFLEGELVRRRSALETLKAVLRDTEERLEAVTVESLRAQDDVSMYAKKMEEVESKATFDETRHRNEVDDLTRALKEADLRQQAAWSRVKEFEKTVEKQQNTINASEVAHSKAVTKLTFTRNKLNLLVQDSQELVGECESLHKSLQERDIEIVELNHEVDKLKNVIHIEQSQRMDTSSKTSLQLTLLQDELARANEKSATTVKDLREQLVALQCLLKEKDSGLEGVRTRIEDILLKGDNVLWMEHNIVHRNKGEDGVADIDVRSMNGCLDFTSAFTTLEERFSNLVAEAQLHRISSDKKEAQIQKLKEDLHDISIERTTLMAGLQAKTMEVERLRSEVNSKGLPVECNISAESEIEELGTRSTWAGTGNPVTPHVRGPRRHSQADIAIDMVDANNSNLLSDMNDKEHGFSALTNSRLVPKAARILTDRLDGLWFVGGRILTRQPSARLGLAMYWIFIHIYMAMIISRGIL